MYVEDIQKINNKFAELSNEQKCVWFMRSEPQAISICMTRAITEQPCVNLYDVSVHVITVYVLTN